MQSEVVIKLYYYYLYFRLIHALNDWDDVFDPSRLNGALSARNHATSTLNNVRTFWACVMHAYLDH